MLKLKIIIKDILKNKGRTLITLMCISFAAALFLASLSIIRTVMKSYEESSRVLSGNSDIVISSDAGAKNPFFEKQEFYDNIDYQIGVTALNGVYRYGDEFTQMIIRAMSIQDIKDMELLDIDDNSQDDFKDDSIIVSKGFANKYGYDVGDTVTLEINEKQYDFTVYDTALPKSMYTDQAYNNQVFIPRNKIESLTKSDGKSNLIYVKLKNTDGINNDIANLQEVYPEQNVKEAFSKEEFNEKMQGVVMIFIVTSISIVIMCFMIVYNNFKFIINERYKTLGILRSVGANKGYIKKMIILEGAIYGILGSIIGGGIGSILTYVVGNMLKPEYLKSTVFNMRFKDFLYALIFTLVISIVVSINSIRKTMKVSIKELSTSAVKYEKVKHHKIITILSMIIFVGNFMTIIFIPSNVSIKFLIVSIIISIISFIGVIPLFTKVLLYIFEKLYKITFKNLGYISLQNIKNTKSFFSNSILMAISIGVILMINSSLSSIQMQNVEVVKDSYNCDYIISTNKNDDKISKMVKESSNVKSVYEQVSIDNVDVVNRGDKSIFTIDGVNDDYLDYRNFDVDKKLIKENDSERWILLSDSLRNKLDVEENDELVLKINNKECSYRVKGFFETAINNGNYALMSNKYLIEDLDNNYFNQLYVKTIDDNDYNKAELKSLLNKYNPTIKTPNDLLNDAFESSKAMYITIKVISILPIIIGVVIIIGNSIINFYERKRNIAVFRSIGMNKGAVRKMMLFQQLTGGLIGGILGCGLGNLLIFEMKLFLNNIHNKIPIGYSVELNITLFLAEVIIYLLPFLMFSIKGLNFNIAKEVRLQE
ncbi:FtsX-like permease family protein [Clostridium cibarium]|uniref:ABC transporter permease n=1 Tax=Clostridium cibarium TaxID=2762247 RepID=A0ABR8PTA7_9CLOT|nr:FtsX-like permease family protein [Clostridium cibarium]MBD7911389.1 ABC transporter permease [Clostridium cibarium]